MAQIVAQFTYNAYIIDVPERVENNAKKISNAFDKWLYDKSNDHGLWLTVNGKKKAAIGFGCEDFVNYLNDHVIKNGEEKAAIVQVFQDSDYKPEKEMKILYF